MNHLLRAGRRAVRWLLPLLVATITGCANFYVDGATKEVAVSDFKKPAQPRPAQVLFEFQTKGAANGRATELLKTRVIEQVKASGIFASVSEAPAPGGALLSVTLNNVPLTDDAFSRGFITGFTFGLAGSQVSDGYICTVRYSAAANAQAIVKQARHAVHATIGVAAAPGNAVKADNVDAAVTLMTRQVLSNVLNDLSRDGAFQ
jgi:hypothetical protein